MRYIFFLCYLCVALVVEQEFNTVAAIKETPQENISEKTSAFVTVSYADGKISADYKLGKSVSSFPFFAKENPYFASSWQIQSDVLLITNNMVKSIDGRDFDRFTILISPEPEDTSNSWSLAKIGDEGVVLQTGYLLGNKEIFETTICILDRPSVCDAIPDMPPAFDHKMSGVIDPVTASRGSAVYFGVQDYENHYDYRFLFDSATPEWLANSLREELKYSLKFHENTLYWTFDTPISIFTHFDGEHDINQWRADATDGGAYVFRFRGDGFTPKNDFVQRTVAKYIYLNQNNRIALNWFNQKDVMENPWFYVGSIGYWTDSMMQKRFDLEQKQTDRDFQTNMRACLENKAQIAALAEENKEPVPVAQECGYVFMWLVDTLIKTKSEQQSDMFSVWQSLLGVKVREGGLRQRFLRQILDIDEDSTLAGFFYSLNKPTLEYVNALRLSLVSVGREDLANRYFPEVSDTTTTAKILNIFENVVNDRN
ncbi:hypothetical protein [Kordiimonas sp. SCSIO 12610]|uniref:hypothetical protein n=1 Tax=Kordiimonas sp. SCSIO 12610 TaxID=2829597 RepID=UPI00210F0397|nr:hypothetical protein [Kordiimonas sp. SCSIO 12610]UTW56062.1 hypothetical protein KFF44_03985 [Kordiimonas sp. SCSIO 12610]